MSTPAAPRLPTLAEIEAAARLVYGQFQATPQYRWGLLEQRLGTECWLKHENHNPVGAFKIRGGLAYFDALARSGQLPREVISATRGNHGQSIAWAARGRGVACTIVVPLGNSLEKNAAMRALGAQLVEHGEDFQEAREHALQLARERGAHMVPSYHHDLVCGVATYWLELLRAAPHLDVLYVPIGLGSGACAAVADWRQCRCRGVRPRVAGWLPGRAIGAAAAWAGRCRRCARPVTPATNAPRRRPHNRRAWEPSTLCATARPRLAPTTTTA